ncbi:MAG: Hsp20/alpha crystallin family protein [Candidatus Nitrotoga sp.]
MSEKVIKRENASEESAAMRPAVNVVEDATGITLYADLPGVPKEKLSIHVEGDNLILEGELEINSPPNMEAIHAEVDLSRYRRVFTLSRELDGDKVSAGFRHGVLELRIPKAEHAQPRRIVVQAT